MQRGEECGGGGGVYVGGGRWNHATNQEGGLGVQETEAKLRHNGWLKGGGCVMGWWVGVVRRKNGFPKKNLVLRGTQ